MAASVPEEAAGIRRTAVSPAYARYALGLLLLVYIFNFVDRQILSVLLESIKAEIPVSDAELGFLGGIAFALLYSVLGIPIARWADRGSRVSIITLSLVVWSGMTAVTGAARSFAALLVARVGVGIGEAGCSPPAHSLLADYFPPERRGTAFSIYAIGIPLGVSLGNLVGAWVGSYFGWRLAFVAVGVPGLLIALVVRLTLREPVRGASEGRTADAPAVPASETTWQVMRFLAGLRSFVHLSLAGALHAFVGYGAGFFLASFLARVHHMGLAERGSWLAGLALVGALGTFLGGALSDRFGRSDARWYMWVPAIATVAGVPIALGFYLVPNVYVALAIGVLSSIAGPMYLGPSFAMTQTLVHPRMRAMASAVLLFIINLIGLGLGPWFVGYASDLLMPHFGDQSLRVALASIVSVGNAWATAHYVLAARSLRSDLQAKHAVV